MAEFQVEELIENRYRVLSVIGAGGMGTLYRVSDEAREGEIVALKTVRLRGLAAESPERAEYFQREFQLLTQLRHPNLVSVYDFGITTEGELYFTMEWLEGEDLEPSIRPLEPAETIPVMVQVCRALAYLHARGVIHGDLKPGNVLIAGDGGDFHRVKLVDFGLAQEIRSPEDRARYYSPGYTAPEVRTQRSIDHRTDLYSLGAMWYALLVGEAPMFMPGVGKERLIRFALDEALERQDQIPQALGGVIARLMATSPDSRYSSANEVIEAINEVTGSTYALETQETASSYALRTYFVNREEEIETLQTLWEQAQSGVGKLVLISGESGVGKSRLMAELEIRMEMEGARVVWGQCVESGGSAYHPWREVLRVLVRYIEGADETVMQRVGPVLAALLPELWERDYMQVLEPPAALDPQAARQRLNDVVIQVFHTAAGLRPTAIMIENIQWADEATLELLRYLARIPGQASLMTCVTYRDDEIEPDHLLEKLEGEQVQRLRVHRLSPEMTTELVCSMLGLEQLPALLTERVHQTTEGNAFFVQELIRSLATEGKVLRRTVAGWEVDGRALQGAELPESISQVVWRRMGQLSAEGRQVLGWAAVTGMFFWEGGAAAVGQVVWQRVRMALREGLEQGLVAARDETAFAGEREYLFLNPMVWEVCYESVPREERGESHARAAAWLMARNGGEAGEHLGLIADHLEKAGQIEQAVTYLRQAGEQAAARFANAEAVAYFSRALDLTLEDNLGERYTLLLAREKVYDLQGTRQAQVQDLAALEGLTELLGDDRQRIDVALRWANYAFAISDYPATVLAAQGAIDLAQAIGDADKEATGYVRWGQALWRQGKYDAAQVQYERALTLARSTGLRQIEADGLRNLGLLSFYQGDYARASSYFEQALGIEQEIGDRRGESVSLVSIGTIFRRQGDYVQAKSYLERALLICREIGDRSSESRALGNLGTSYANQGDYDRARTLYEQSLRVYREIGERGGESFRLYNLALLHHLLDDNEAAREYSRQALLLGRDIGQQATQAYALTSLGHALTGLGDLAGAVTSYQQALDIRRELGQSNLAIESLAGLARVFLAQEDLAQAQARVEEIISHLETGTLDGAEEPFRIYLTCYCVLSANQDSRAETILDTAHRLLQERAAKISDEEMHRSFLDNVAAHREIVQEFEKGA
jgi:tetratricopeptide (TPR) repeat protein